ncbi:FtsX-like permease family protein [Buchnera aphidicola (Kurisakia onigurumii)]|uniref:FtsX-like permease family protein n=1 Tax=Buchnera aphidicola TaxID=9 RepID=UPI0031B6A53B
MIIRIYLHILFRCLWSSYNSFFLKIMIFFSMLGILLGIISLFIVVSMMNGMSHYFKKNLLSKYPHIIITTKNNKVQINNFPKEIILSKKIYKIIPFISKLVFLKKNNYIFMKNLIGIKKKYNIKKNKLINLHRLFFFKKKYINISISFDTAKIFKLYLGDIVEIIVPFYDKSDNFIKKEQKIKCKVSGIFKLKGNESNEKIFLHQHDIRNILHFSNKNITGWNIWINNPLHVSDVIDKFNFSSNFIFQDWRDTDGTLFTIMKIENSIMRIFVFIIMILSFINIAISTCICIQEKKNSIAIFKTLGLTNKNIFFLFICYIMIIGFSGVLCSNIIMFFLLFKINIINIFLNIINTGLCIPMELNIFQIFLINFCFLLLIILFTIYPIYYISKICPIKVLIHE